MTNLTEPQRTALLSGLTRMESLDEELRRLGDKAIATGDLEDDDMLNGRSYSSIVFNMGRAYDAGCVALGVVELSELKLNPFMTDPDEIIARCEFLIDAGLDMLFDLRRLFGEAQP